MWRNSLLFAVLLLTGCAAPRLPVDKTPPQLTIETWPTEAIEGYAKAVAELSGARP